MLSLFAACFSASVGAQFFSLPGTAGDSAMFKNIYNEALLRGQCYSRLGELCKTIGHRLSGSDAAEKAVVWGVDMLNSYGFDSVYTQPVMVPRWERSETEELWLTSEVFKKQVKTGFTADYNCEAFTEQELKPKAKHRLQACALGGSVGGDITAKLLVVHSQQELDSFGKAGMMRGRIVLLNRAFDEQLLNTFAAYGACVGQRYNGASQVAEYGAAGLLVHSMTNRCDLHPHTGSLGYKEGVEKIPAMAVASAVANLLEELSRTDPEMVIAMKLGCRTLDDRLSANVLAETRGAESPVKVIVFGGHYDSWDEGEGAHDDGAGCMHAFEALRILKAVGYIPRHTLRCVWWMNEENGLRGATEYARLAENSGEVHLAALESDRGGFTPRGFGIDSALMPLLLRYRGLLNMYGLHSLEYGGGGADIGPLKRVNPSVKFVSFIPDSQRYFDVHHAETDVFENVNKRELELGAAAVAVMIWMLDQGLD